MMTKEQKNAIIEALNEKILKLIENNNFDDACKLIDKLCLFMESTNNYQKTK